MLINKITTVYGDHSSLLPLFTKDVVNSAGMTAFSYDAGGKIEAKDKCIDEFGTQAIWLGGLPFFKWLSNKTIYKFAKINPDVDVRLIDDKVQLKHAKKYAENLDNTGFKGYKQAIDFAGKNSKLTKGLFISKFAAATALTLASYFTLVKVKQNYTKKQIEKEFWAKKTEQHFMNNAASNNPAFKAFNMDNQEPTPVKPNKNVSFKGLGSLMKGFMFNPVQNLFIIDAGISGERLANARTKTETAETAIKEGTFLFFMYVAGKYVQQGIEKISEKILKKPIDLHAEVLDSNDLKAAIKSGKAQKDINKIKELSKDLDAFFEFVYNDKNADNEVIKAAKQSKIIKTVENGSWSQKLLGKAQNTNKINPLTGINPKEILSLSDNIEKLINMSPKNTADIDGYLKACRNHKVISVAANMAVTCLFLGLILPYSIMKYREKQQNGSKDFHVQSEIEKQLEKNFKARIA